MFDEKLYKESFSALRAPEDTLERVCDKLRRGSHRRVPRTALLAAILVPLFIISAFAIGYNAIHAHKTEKGETMSGSVMQVNIDTGLPESRRVEHSGTGMWFSFDIAGDCREVKICPGWLPEDDPQARGYINGVAQKRIVDGEGDGIAYCIEVYNGGQLRDMKYFLTGECVLVRQDTWNVYDRIEVEAKHSNPPWRDDWTDYHLILFSSEYGYMIHIGGQNDAGADMEAMEEIAENLKVVIGDEQAARPQRGGADICSMDIARG